MVDDRLSRLCFQISGALYRANILWLQKLLFVPAWMSRVGRCVLEPLFSCEFDRHYIIMNVNPDHADRPRPILTINQTSVTCECRWELLNRPAEHVACWFWLLKCVLFPRLPAQ